MHTLQAMPCSSAFKVRRCLWARWSLAVLLCQSGLAMAQAQGDMATLFYTPAQRQEISRGRQPQSGAQVLSSTRLTGVVQRAGGQGTVWINGQPYAEGTPQAGLIQGVDAVVDGRRLRVGEGIDKLSGAHSDVVAPGAVTVRGKR